EAAVEEAPEPPPVERRRPSILELFRSSRPRDRVSEPEGEADTTSILRLHDTVSEPVVEAPSEEPAETIESHEAEPVVEEPSPIFMEQAAAEDVTAEAETEPAPPPAERVVEA